MLKLNSAIALTVLSLALPFAQSAQAGPWSSRPSWASGGEESGGSQGRSYTGGDRGGSVSPFAPGSHNLSVDVGQVFLMGDLAANYTDSIGTQINYAYGVSDMFAFHGSLGYSVHGNSKLTADGRFSMTTALAGMRMNLSWYDKIVPYLIFGLGFYRPSFEIVGDSGIASLSPILFGLHIGPGIHLELTRSVFFGAGLTFHNMFGSTQRLPNNQFKDVGGNFVSLLLHAGVTF